MIKHLCKLVWNRKRINFLITIEIFFSFLVLFSVIVFAVYYLNNYLYPLGFNYENIWSIQVDTRSGSDEKDKLQRLARTKQIIAALREFGEVESAAAIWAAPYSRGDWTSSRKLKDGSDFEYSNNETSDDLKVVLGLNVVRGRWFSNEDDGVTNYKPVVINQRMARAFFGDDDPIGKDISDPTDRVRNEQRVVGVIDDFRKNGEFSELGGYVFNRANFSNQQSQLPRFFLIKVRPDTTAVFEEKLLARLQPEAKDWSFNIKTMTDMRANTFQEYLVPMTAFALVAGFLLIMVGLGLTGVLWLNVTQRTKEIGLRRAKGATKRRIYHQILGEMFIITSLGLLAGVLVVVQFPLLNFLGFADSKVYTLSIIISLVLIYLLTALCGLYPGRLATKVQPAEALHYE